MSCDAIKKTGFRVSDQVQHNLACAVTEADNRFEIFYYQEEFIVLSV